MLFAFIIVFSAIFIDQMVKFWVISSLNVLESATLMPNIIDLLHVRNTGASWGILAGQRYLFIGLTLVVIIYLVGMITRPAIQSLERIGYSLVLGGAVGNLIDRIRFGYVVDMFQLKFVEFPIFNVADVALTLGILILIINVFFEKSNHTKENA